jgi:hypothetical protein
VAATQRPAQLTLAALNCQDELRGDTAAKNFPATAQFAAALPEAEAAQWRQRLQRAQRSPRLEEEELPAGAATAEALGQAAAAEEEGEGEGEGEEPLFLSPAPAAAGGHPQAQAQALRLTQLAENLEQLAGGASPSPSALGGGGTGHLEEEEEEPGLGPWEAPGTPSHGGAVPRCVPWRRPTPF